jgi:hypothetical protein
MTGKTKRERVTLDLNEKSNGEHLNTELNPVQRKKERKKKEQKKERKTRKKKKKKTRGKRNTYITWQQFLLHNVDIHTPILQCINISTINLHRLSV